MNRIFVHISVVAALMASALPASAQNSWSSKTACPEYVGYGAGASAAGRFYVIAGYDMYWGEPSTDMLEYTPSTDSWTTRAAAPAGIYQSAVAFKGKVLVFGGYDPFTGAELATTNEYDPSSNTWRARAPMPSPRWLHGAGATASHAYVIAGISSGARTNTAARFDPDANSWSVVPNHPVSVEGPFAGVVLGRLYVAGGWSDSGPSNQTHEYDPGANVWTRRRDMPNYGSAWGGSASLGGRLWCLGGDGYNAPWQNNLAYHPYTDAWTWYASLPLPHYFGMAAACGGKIYRTGSADYYYAPQLHEYTPASFGGAPAAPANLRQLDASGQDVTAGGWVSGGSIEFTADVTDPDSGDHVFLEVEAVPVGQAFAGAANVQGDVAAPGTLSARFTVPDGADYKWRARAVDVSENASAWVDFGGAADTDFRHDMTPPTAPAAVTPAASQGVSVPNKGGGPVHFEWTAAADNAGVARYEVEVSMEDGFFNTLQRTTTTTTSIDLALGTSRFAYFWRVRAIDVSGIAGPWSPVATFFVQWNDPVDHGSGDASKVCGFSAGGTGSIIPLAAALVALAGLVRRFRRVLPGALVLAAALPCAAQDSWVRKADCPYLVSEAGAATVNGRIYVFGGYSFSFFYQMYRYTYEYDPATNAWQYRTNMPTGMGDVAVAVDNGVIYSLGGWADSSYYLGYYTYGLQPWCFAYDVAGNSWRRIADLPTTRGYAAAGALGGRIYCAGGMDVDYLSVDAVEEYDPGSNTWTARAPLPEATMVPFHGVAGGRLIVAGGWLNDGSAGAKTYAYDASQNAWTRLADMPAGNYGGASAVVGDRLYCFGSWADASMERRNYEYGTLSNRWVRRADMPAGLAMGVAAEAGDKAYTFGHTADYSLATRAQEYTLPDFGLPPAGPAAMQQNAPGGASLPAGSWVGGDTMEFSADLDDPDGDEVALEIEVRPVTDPFQGVATVAGAFGPVGRRTVAWSAMTPGDYKWQARTLDSRDNVSAWVEFGPAAGGADFRNEQGGPAAPSPVSPSMGQGVETGGAVTFTWQAATDPSGIASYDLVVAADPSFVTPQASGSTSGTSLDLGLAPSWQFYYWRVRATDTLGNVGEWSPGVRFTVVLNETYGSEEKKGCLGSATASTHAAGLLLAMILAAAAGRVR